MRLFILLPMLFLLGLPAQAQTKYSAWTNPDQSAGGGVTRELIQRLDKLIDEAEKARAADPAFLRDLRDLARSYDTLGSLSRNRTVLSDDFLDGDFTTNPVWTVSRGRYWIESGWGLRSAVDVQDQTQQPEKKKSSKRDTALAILGAVLNQSVGGSTQATVPTGPKIAAIHTPAAIGNAFTINLDFSSWVQQGQPSGGNFEIGPYQGNDRSSGYRLTYTSGEGLTLLTVSPKGRRVIDQSIGPMMLEDKKTHALNWTRDTTGRMKVSVDGKEILNTVDRAFGDSFQGLEMINRGGDYIVKNVTVSSGN